MTEPSTSVEIHSFKRSVFLAVVRLAMLLVFCCLTTLILAYIVRGVTVSVVPALEGGMWLAVMIAGCIYCPKVLYYVNSGAFPSAAQRAAATESHLVKVEICRFIFGVFCLTVGCLLSGLGFYGGLHWESIVMALFFSVGTGAVLLFPAYMASWGRDVPALDDKTVVGVDNNSPDSVQPRE